MEGPILAESGYDIIFPVKNDVLKMHKYNEFLKHSKTC